MNIKTENTQKKTGTTDAIYKNIFLQIKEVYTNYLEIYTVGAKIKEKTVAAIFTQEHHHHRSLNGIRSREVWKENYLCQIHR